MPEKVYESKSPILFELIKPIKTDDLWSIHLLSGRETVTVNKAIIFFVGIIAWMVLVNVLVSLQDDFLELDLRADSNDIPIDSIEKLSPRNSVLSIRIKDD